MAPDPKGNLQLMAGKWLANRLLTDTVPAVASPVLDYASADDRRALYQGLLQAARDRRPARVLVTFSYADASGRRRTGRALAPSLERAASAIAACYPAATITSPSAM